VEVNWCSYLEDVAYGQSRDDGGGAREAKLMRGGGLESWYVRARGTERAVRVGRCEEASQRRVAASPPVLKREGIGAPPG
jgi:hypothetical protein